MISSRVISAPQGEAQPWVVSPVAEADVGNGSDESEETDLEAVLETARADGFEQGYSQGMQQAQAEIEAACAERIDQLEALLEAFATPAISIDQRLEQELVELTVSVARQIVQMELKTSTEAVQALVTQALDTLPPSDSPVQLQLHPDDAAIVAQRVEAMHASRPIEIIATDTIAKGGCLVSSGAATVDARVERVDQLIAETAAQAIEVRGGLE